jgi:large subunit ribosomal protein L29
MLKAKDLRNESAEELDVKLASLRQEIYNLRSEQLENKSKQTHLIGQKRKEIARILTVKGEKK